MAGPDHLPVYLTNRCNLACSYCYVAVNQGPPARLDFEGLARAIDEFLGADPADKKITFLGGEPFLDFELMARAARYVRDKAGDAVVMQTFTNGTLLTPERHETLRGLGVHVNISLDGKSEVNDLHRVFHGDKEGRRSVLREALERLEGLPKDNLGVSLVFTSGTVDRLLENVDYFYRLGFPRITFTPELYERWPEDKLKTLGVVLAGFRRYYHKILAGGARPFQIQILFSVLENHPRNLAGERWWHRCHNVTLGPDGEYYACDKALSFPVGRAASQRTGGAGRGLDARARDEHYARAIAYIEERGWGGEEYFCPMGPYFYSEIAGEDPEARLENFHRVSKIFSDALLGLIEDNKALPAFRRLYEDLRVV